eukprot:scaffold4905_cov298-Pinguiococcus_pyrenoidosus.AAC.1
MRLGRLRKALRDKRLCKSAHLRSQLCSGSKGRIQGRDRRRQEDDVRDGEDVGADVLCDVSWFSVLHSRLQIGVDVFIQGCRHVAIDTNNGEQEDEDGSRRSSQDEGPKHGARLGQKGAIGEDRIKEWIGKHSLHQPDDREVDAVLHGKQLAVFHGLPGERVAVVAPRVVAFVLQAVHAVRDDGQENNQEDHSKYGLDGVTCQRRSKTAQADVGERDERRDYRSHPPLRIVEVTVEASHHGRVGPNFLVQAIGHREREADRGDWPVAMVDGFWKRRVPVVLAHEVDDNRSRSETRVVCGVGKATHPAVSRTELGRVLNGLRENPADERRAKRQRRASVTGDEKQEESVDAHPLPLNVQLLVRKDNLEHDEAEESVGDVRRAPQDVLELLPTPGETLLVEWEVLQSARATKCHSGAARHGSCARRIDRFDRTSLRRAHLPSPDARTVTYAEDTLRIRRLRLLRMFPRSTSICLVQKQLCTCKFWTAVQSGHSSATTFAPPREVSMCAALTSSRNGFSNSFGGPDVVARRFSNVACKSVCSAFGLRARDLHVKDSEDPKCV